MKTIEFVNEHVYVKSISIFYLYSIIKEQLVNIGHVGFSQIFFNKIINTIINTSFWFTQHLLLLFSSTHLIFKTQLLVTIRTRFISHFLPFFFQNPQFLLPTYLHYLYYMLPFQNWQIRVLLYYKRKGKGKRHILSLSLSLFFLKETQTRSSKVATGKNSLLHP